MNGGPRLQPCTQGSPTAALGGVLLGRGGAGTWRPKASRQAVGKMCSHRLSQERGMSGRFCGWRRPWFLRSDRLGRGLVFSTPLITAQSGLSEAVPCEVAGIHWDHPDTWLRGQALLSCQWLLSLSLHM